MPAALRESTTITRAAATEAQQSGNLLVQHISPGWGSSGYYSAEVLEQAVVDQVLPAGTPMYADHPTAADVRDRPVRSIRDLMAVTTSDARVATDDDIARGADLGALVSEARVFSPYRTVLAEMVDVIGTSIRGDATDITPGEAEGRRGSIIEGIAHVKSVDFVTRAGRGGRVIDLMESAAAELLEQRNVGQWVESRIHRDFTILADDMAGEGRLTRPERIQLSSAIGDALAAFVDNLETNAPQLYQRDLWDNPSDAVSEALDALAAGTRASARRAIARGLSEATVNDTREALQVALRDAHADDSTWIYVRDFDATTVWFDLEGDSDANGIYAQTYTSSDAGGVELTGDRTEVRIVTTYVPATRPDGTSTEESEEDTMPQIQIEEAEHNRLVEAAGRVTSLEERATTAERERDEARATLAEQQRTTRATALIDEAAGNEVEFTALERTGLLFALPLTEAGDLNEEEFTTTVNTHVAEKKKAGGAGRFRSMGGHQAGGLTESADDKLAAIDKALGIEQKGA